MTEDTRDHAIVGRRAEDGAVLINPKRLKTWVTLAIACIGLLTLVWNALASQVVRPHALQVVTDSIRHVADQQDTFGVMQTRQNARLTAVEDRLSRVEDALEILATDACLKRRQQPYEYRKLKCNDYLGE
jgi:hypothetical protein